MRLALSFFLLAACGGTGSGLPKDITLAELDEAQWEQLCEWTAEEFPAATECDDGTTYEFGTVEECATAGQEAFGACDASIEDYEECYVVIAADPCSSDFPAECAWLLTCAFASI